MTLSRLEARELLEGFLKAGVDCVITGEAQSGKTSIARALAPEAAILHGFELTNEYLGAIRSIVNSSKTIVVENAAQENMKLLEQILSTRTILGAAIDCRFIVTTRESLPLEGCAIVKLSPITPEEWIERAKRSKIHPAIIALVEEDHKFLSRHDLKTIEALSKVLSARPSVKTLAKTLSAMLGKDEEAIAVLAANISAPISSLDQICSSTDENAKAYESVFLETIKTNPKKEEIARFSEYISSLAATKPKEALSALKSLLNGAKAADALEKVLSEKSVRDMIDVAIEEID
jgi:hypothetical protein